MFMNNKMPSDNISLITILASGLTFVAALQWSNAFQALLKKWFPIDQQAHVWIQFIFAFVITIFTLIIIYSITHVTHRLGISEYLKLHG
jgi:uncharacterized BrkB/YihY/UPF0761 family membrane protein